MSRSKIVILFLICLNGFANQFLDIQCKAISIYEDKSISFENKLTKFDKLIEHHCCDSSNYECDFLKINKANVMVKNNQKAKAILILLDVVKDLEHQYKQNPCSADGYVANTLGFLYCNLGPLSARMGYIQNPAKKFMLQSISCSKNKDFEWRFGECLLIKNKKDKNGLDMIQGSLKSFEEELSKTKDKLKICVLRYKISEIKKFIKSES